MLSVGAVLAGDGVWTSAGPDGGRVSGLVASPDTANVFYAVSRGGVFKTVDGGVNWSEASAGINRQLNGLIVHSRTGADRLFAFGTRKAFYTQNGGASWLDRTPAPALLGSDDRITAVAGSRTSPGTYFIGLGDGPILQTSNSGNSWSVLPSLPLPAGSYGIAAIDTHPVMDGVVLLSTIDLTGAGDHRVYSGDVSPPLSPTPWTLVPCASGCLWDNSHVTDFEFSGVAGRVWATTQSSGVGRSDDFGATWTAPGGAVAFIQGTRLSAHPSDPAEVYLAGNRVGVAFTVDGGATWTEVFGGFVGNAQFQPAESSVVVHDPFNPSLQLVGSTSNGVYRRIALPPADNFAPGVAGFNAANIRAVATNLGDVVHAGIGDSFGATFASFRGTSNGTVWSQANGGLEADQFRALTVDPNDPDVIYAGGVYRAKVDSTGSGFDPGNGGIYKSVDRGVTWTTIDTGIPVTGGMFSNSLFGTVRDIEVDRSSAGPGGDSQTLWAGGSGRWTVDDCSLGSPTFTQASARIFVSNDAGATWTASDSGIGSAQCTTSGFVLYASVVQIVQDPNNPSTVWAATFIGAAQSGDAPTIPNGVFRSTDGGTTWNLRSSGLPHIDDNPALSNESVLSLAIDPTDITGGTLYASTNQLNSGSPLGTIYKTTDGGLTWSASGAGLANRDVRDLVVDPATGNVYAAVADPLSNGDGGIFVSDDGGATWASVSTGFPEAAVATKIEIDNTGSPGILHAGTSRGIQSFTLIPDGDTDGATNPVEEGSPNAGDGNGDGTPDATQSSVASPTVANPSRGTSSYLTAEIAGQLGACPGLENSFGLDLLPSVPVESAHEAPFNGLHLRIPDCEQAMVQLIYHGEIFTSDPSFAIRAYGLAFPDEDTTAWFEIDSGSVSGDTWTFELIDGGIGDATPDDGVIVFQGAAKRLREAFFSDSMEAE